MYKLRPALGGNVWMLGQFIYFKVTGPDDIAVVDPISETLWLLPSNIPPSLHPRRSQQPPPPLCPHSERPSSSTMHPDYSDATPLSYTQTDPMQTDIRQDIAALQQTMTGLCLDYQHYSMQVSGYCDEVLGYCEDFTDFHDEFFCCFPSSPKQSFSTLP